MYFLTLNGSNIPNEKYYPTSDTYDILLRKRLWIRIGSMQLLHSCNWNDKAKKAGYVCRECLKAYILLKFKWL